LPDQQWVRERSRFHQPYAVLERTTQTRGDGKSETGLATAADAGRGDGAPVTTAHQVGQAGNFPIAPDESVGWVGKLW